MSTIQKPPLPADTHCFGWLVGAMEGEASQAPPAWGWAAPLATAVAAGACLAWGTKLGYQRALTVAISASKEGAKGLKGAPPSGSSLPANTVVDGSGTTAGLLAMRAFLYGSAIAWGTSAAAVTAAVWLWDVHNVSQNTLADWPLNCWLSRPSLPAAQPQEFADGVALHFPRQADFEAAGVTGQVRRPQAPEAQPWPLSTSRHFSSLLLQAESLFEALNGSVGAGLRNLTDGWAADSASARAEADEADEETEDTPEFQATAVPHSALPSSAAPTALTPAQAFAARRGRTAQRSSPAPASTDKDASSSNVSNQQSAPPAALTPAQLWVAKQGGGASPSTHSSGNPASPAPVALDPHSRAIAEALDIEEWWREEEAAHAADLAQREARLQDMSRRVWRARAAAPESR